MLKDFCTIFQQDKDFGQDFEIFTVLCIGKLYVDNQKEICCKRRFFVTHTHIQGPLIRVGPGSIRHATRREGRSGSCSVGVYMCMRVRACVCACVRV